MITTQPLERVRAALFGRRAPGKHSRSTPPQGAPQTRRNRPSPDVWGARLVTARRQRRERHAPPVQPRAEWEPTGALVRPYVAALGEAPRTARAGAQARPWGDAQ
jgi:hypothetical protein